MPPVVVRDELDSKALVEYGRIPEVTESFYAIVKKRRFPNQLLVKLIEASGKGEILRRATLNTSAGESSSCPRRSPFESAKIICIAGAGIAMLPTFLVAGDAGAVRLVQLLARWKQDAAQISSVHATFTVPSARMRASLDFLHKILGAGQPWDIDRTI